MARQDYQPPPQYPDLERMVQQRRLGYLDEQALLRTLNQQRMLSGQQPARSIEEAIGAPPRQVTQTEVAPVQLDPKAFAGRGVSTQATTAPQDSGMGSAFAGLGEDLFRPPQRPQPPGVPLPRPRPPDAPGPAPSAAQPAPPAAQPRTRLPLWQQNAQAGDTPGHFANVRTNNPGAQAFSGTAANQFGATAQRTGTGHSIAAFPSPVHGAASNMDLYTRNYTGRTISDAIGTWSGGGRRTIPGYDPNMVITREMMADPKIAIPLMKAIARGEAPGRYPMTDAQWEQAHQWALQGRAGSRVLQQESPTPAISPAVRSVPYGPEMPARLLPDTGNPMMPAEFQPPPRTQQPFGGTWSPIPWAQMQPWGWGAKPPDEPIGGGPSISGEGFANFKFGGD